ncbi:hypothetical protein L6164_019941 [Bauhinia variegata]|uniref:Uncharacterized protein n=1 Tax=Bauhinia variegata TaxID=167791 RepID=A0ACB9MTV4_BAUVA|nr:hypothetical protein L6164_019941 [Bauhinia variegata]
MELSLDLSLGFVPKTVSEFLGEISRSRDRSEKLSMLDDFVKRLEEEMRKIDAFKRELPLCVLLVNDAITRLKKEAARCMEIEDRPVIEEFIPSSSKTSSGENGQLSIMGRDGCEKKNWMSSAQLWSTETKSRNEHDDWSVPENPIQSQNQKSRGEAFIPFKGNSCFQKELMKEDKEVSQVPSLCLMTPPSELHSNSKLGSKGSNASSLLTQSLQQTARKQRRCWSPELHRRFVDALQQLGGAQVATPKQIRELMQVEGLTNDEVKSHLQKYRLHVRRVAPTNGLWTGQDQCEEISKGKLSESGSPQSPLLLGGSAKGFSCSGRSSTDAEEDEKSDCHSWRDGHKL